MAEYDDNYDDEFSDDNEISAEDLIAQHSAKAVAADKQRVESIDNSGKKDTHFIHDQSDQERQELREYSQTMLDNIHISDNHHADINASPNKYAMGQARANRVDLDARYKEHMDEVRHNPENLPYAEYLDAYEKHDDLFHEQNPLAASHHAHASATAKDAAREVIHNRKKDSQNMIEGDFVGSSDADTKTAADAAGEMGITADGDDVPQVQVKSRGLQTYIRNNQDVLRHIRNSSEDEGGEKIGEFKSRIQDKTLQQSPSSRASLKNLPDNPKMANTINKAYMLMHEKVQHQARKMAEIHGHRDISADDFASVGFRGLLEAAARHDKNHVGMGDKGPQHFETMALNRTKFLMGDMVRQDDAAHGITHQARSAVNQARQDMNAGKASNVKDVTEQYKAEQKAKHDIDEPISPLSSETNAIHDRIKAEQSSAKDLLAQHGTPEQQSRHANIILRKPKGSSTDE